LLIELQDAHRIRNATVHQGAATPVSDAERGVRAARALLDHVAFLTGALVHLPRGAGIGYAVAELLPAGPLELHLREADLAVGRRTAPEAAEHAAFALDWAIRLCRPRLPNSSMDYRIRSSMRRQNTDLAYALDTHSRDISAIERWVVPLALGMRPATYSRLRGIVGSSFTDINGVERGSNRDEDIPLTLADARWATTVTAELVYRLWESDALDLTTDDDEPGS
jgi:hypothetical protein